MTNHGLRKKINKIKILWYLGGFNINYIIFKSIDIHKLISPKTNCEKNEKYLEIFGNTLFSKWNLQN
jgi:hypothetical protein